MRAERKNMKDYKKFRISPENRRDMRTELLLAYIKYFFSEEDGQLYCYAKCSGERFHKLHDRAVCNRLTRETGIMHMTQREADDCLLFWAIADRYGHYDDTSLSLVVI